jgi:6-phosphogluconolactonase/glucosamine-6-phosphate isomerase/deaminase
MTEYVPTLCFGLSKDYENRILQLWVDDLGNLDWRPLPLINVDERPQHERKPRSNSVAGYVEDDPNDRADS